MKGWVIILLVLLAIFTIGGILYAINLNTLAKQGLFKNNKGLSKGQQFWQSATDEQKQDTWDSL